MPRHPAPAEKSGNKLRLFLFCSYRSPRVQIMARSSAAALRRPPVPKPSTPAGDLGGIGIDRQRRRGRGAISNATGRYEPLARVAFDDGWQSLDDLPPFKTTVSIDATRKIITRN